VLRRLESGGFDFGREYLLDFNVDFDVWPPPREAIATLQRLYPATVVYDAVGSDPGYIQFQVYGRVTYELVLRIQKDVTTLMKPYGGVCESWGILHDSAC
jgi:hypothetical protein